MQLSDVVQSVVRDFVSASCLFTALDVSNKVKDVLPFARHREVRDLVRSLFPTDIESANYARTPIQVTLDDGNQVEALLYHPLSDSWDLDNKYDMQKRQQTAARPGQNVTVPVTFGSTPSPTGVITAVPVSPPSNPVAVPAPVAPTSVAANVQWQNLFNSQPSLFPRR